jgi:hypothetical protein
MELTTELHSHLRSYKLGDVCEAFDIQVEEPAHRALGDVNRAIHLWLALKRGRQPKPESVRSLDMAQDHAVVAYCRMDGTPFFVWRWRAAQVDETPGDAMFDYYVRNHLKGEYRRDLLEQGLSRDAADSLQSTFMRTHALTLLNRVNFHRRPLYSNLDAYHEANGKVWPARELGRAMEKSDPDGAVEAYETAIRHCDTCAGLQTEEGLYGEVTRDMDVHHYTATALKAMDRISLILCRAGRAPEAQARAKVFFEAHPEVVDTDAQVVLRRIEKAIRRPR